VVRFVAAALGLFGIYWLAEMTHRFAAVNALHAAVTTELLHLLGAEPARHGTLVSLQGGSLDVVSECSGIYVAILFAAAVVAFPTTWAARWRGLGFGLPLLFAVNLLRLVTLGLVLEHRAALLPWVHEYLWQVLFVLAVALLYLVWIERIVPHARHRAAA
jgi:archaeosortase B (VPXXXP-CTERM-specific)